MRRSEGRPVGSSAVGGYAGHGRPRRSLLAGGVVAVAVIACTTAAADVPVPTPATAVVSPASIPPTAPGAAVPAGGGVGATGRRSAVVTPSRVATVTVWAVGDVACPPLGGPDASWACRAPEVARTIRASGRFHALLALGDLQYQDGTAAEFRGSWGRDFTGIPTLPAPGNHEYHTAAAAGYYRYFGARAGRQWTGRYSVDLGAWHVVSLNTECLSVSAALCRAQYSWLQADLAAATKRGVRCIAAFGHRPRYSPGAHGDNGLPVVGPLFTLLRRGGADLYLSGHDHVYARYTTRPVQLVVGTGGAQPRPTNTGAGAKTALRPAVTRGMVTGAARLVLAPGRATVTFVDVDGAFTDAVTVRC